MREESTEEVKKEKEDTENRQAQEQKDTQDTNDVKDIRQKAETTAVPSGAKTVALGACPDIDPQKIGMPYHIPFFPFSR